ncbi:zinc ribbon domain-containing protein [Peribacillus sp. JNUCC 23]
MNELHEKLGSGLNKIQDSFQTNKLKIQIAQDVNQYKRTIQEASLKRNEVLLQLGEELYKKLRNKEIQSDELSKKVNSLIELDRTIFKSQQAIAELHASTVAENSCQSCGTIVTPDDKFCGGCGAKVEKLEQAVTLDTISCHICEVQISANSSFCSCCGTKLV